MSSSKRQDRSTPEMIQVGGYQIYGVSVAAVETCVCLPAFSLAFDAGKCPHGAINMRYMAVTHGHSDHVHGLPLHLATRSLQRLPRPKYFMPPEIVPDVKNLVDAVARLEQAQFSFDPHAMSPKDDPFELKRGWELKSFPTQHPVPSQGYVLIRKSKKLKPEYRGFSSGQLKELRGKGVDIDSFVRTPEIAFTGDTCIDAIAESDYCRNARILITEMTFLDDSCSAVTARKFGHIHIEDVIAQHNIFRRNEFVVFTHFSARYSRKTVQKAMVRLPSELRAKSYALGVGPAMISNEMGGLLEGEEQVQC